jgi:hypothetical protein
MARNADYPAISWVLAAFPRILERILPACVGDIPPKPGAFSGRVVIELRLIIKYDDLLID